MNLADYQAAVRRILAPGPGEAACYGDELLAEGLRQALREYEAAAHPLAAELPAVTGARQDLAPLGVVVQVIAVFWPWTAGLASAEMARRAARWHWAGAGLVEIEDGRPAAGDTLLIYYRKQQEIEGLDGATATTVPAEHAGLLALGAAGWAVSLHGRTQAESPRGPGPAQLRLAAGWSERRLTEFRSGLARLGSVSGPVRPQWADVGL
jgi:hypothetical protein